MQLTRGYAWQYVVAAGIIALALSQIRSYGQTPAPGLAQIPGVSEKCEPGSGAQPWMNANQTPACRALEVIPQMTHEEKVAFRISLPRLGLDATAGGDGPFGLAASGRGGQPNPRAKGTTSFPDELATASTFNRDLAKRLGQSIGKSSTAKG